VEPPVFIVGANRSGTTLLRLILNAHPRIAVPDEIIYFGSYLAGVPVEHWREPNLSATAYERFVDRFLESNCAALNELDKDALKDEILAGRRDFRRPYRCVLEAWARHYGKDRWGEKTPGNLFYADIILDMFPDAQFLYMVRDPRAGVASMQRVSFFPNDVVFNALSRRKHDINGRALLKRNVPISQRRTVRYEDLVRDPEGQMRAICEFLGEDFRPQMLHFHEGADAYMKNAAEQRYNETATHPITDDRVDAWKSSLTTDQIAAVESICAPVMRHFEYPPEARRPSLSRRAEMLLKRGYWRYQCWRHRDVRHFTVKFPLLARTRSRLRTFPRKASQCLQAISPFHPP
jgi:hypothetical protein